jgi:DNA-binding PadR family transcriptional regulator
MAAASLGTLELAILLAVARLGDEAYGLSVRRDLTARVGRDYSVGAVYTTLERLERKGYVRSRVCGPAPTRGGRSRRQFEVTAAGGRAIAHARRAAEQLWGGSGGWLNPETA